jgi:hypothetical protein
MLVFVDVSWRRAGLGTLLVRRLAGDVPRSDVAMLGLLTAALRVGLPAQAAVGNPVDVVASASAEQYGRSLRLLAVAEEVDAIIAVFIPPFATWAEDVAREISAPWPTSPARP